MKKIEMYSLSAALTLVMLILFNLNSYAQNTEIFGSLFFGNTHDLGGIIKTDANGDNYQALKAFKYDINRKSASVDRFSNLTHDNSGNLYFTATDAISTTATIDGEIIAVDTASGNRSIVYSFTGGPLTQPSGSCVYHNGLIYGVTFKGGIQDHGGVYSLDPVTSNFTVLHEFDTTVIGVNTKFYSILEMGSDNKIYMTNDQGGVANFGQLASFDITTNSLNILHDFTASTSTLSHRFGVTEGPSGIFYGACTFGGTNTWGFIYKYDTNTGTYTIVWQANGDLIFPFCKMDYVPSTGKFYGSSIFGGSSFNGSLFEFDPTIDTLITLHSYVDVIDGAQPYGNLIATGNYIYAGVGSGGPGGEGNRHRYNISGDSLEILELSAFPSLGGSNGVGVQLGDKIYTITAENLSGQHFYGGISNTNATTGVIKTLMHHGVISQGHKMMGSFQELERHHLYYSAQQGGKWNYGMVNYYDVQTDSIHTIADLHYDTTGNTCVSGFVQANNGDYYGLFETGGMDSVGTIIKLDLATQTIDVVHHFEKNTSGGTPVGPLVKASNGKLYGATGQGLANNRGGVFSFDPSTNTLDTLVSFEMEYTAPRGVTIDSLDNIFIVFQYAGSSFTGKLVSYNIATNTLTDRFAFTSGPNVGYYPNTPLVPMGDGKYYGMCYFGRSAYTYDPITDAVNFVHHDVPPDLNLTGIPLKATNGKLYALSSEHPFANHTYMSEYDPILDTLIFTQTWNLVAGTDSLHGIDRISLLEYTPCVPTTGVPVIQTACNSFTSPAGVVYTTSGTYDEMFTNADGCDSTQTFVITITDSTSSSISASVCDSYTAPSGAIHTTTGVYTDVILNAAGCDSTITIDLTVLNSTSSSITVSTCDTYTTPSGTVLSATQIYMDTIMNSIGCDSIITIDLTVLSPSSSSIAETTCDTYTTPSGTVLSATGMYMDTIPNSAGCDSIISINLTVFSPSSSSITQTSCDTYTTPSGTILSTTGMYMDTIPNSAGCDSIITINLTVLSPTSSSITETTCDTYTTPSGTILSATGMYTDTIPNSAGCDSIITINLTVLSPTSSSITETTCDTYTTPSGTVLSATGMYTDTIPNSAGCDSIIIINLTVNTVNTAVSSADPTLTSDANGATYQWLDCNNAFSNVPGAIAQNFTPTSNGDYAVLVTELGCSDTSACYTISTIGHLELEIDGGELTLYPNPNNGQFTVELSEQMVIENIEIFSTSGQLVYAESVSNSSTQTIQVHDLESGIYTLRVHSSNRLYVRKLLIK